MSSIAYMAARALRGLSLLVAVGVAAGCMTVTDSHPVVTNTQSSQSLAGKKVAVLPIKTQSSLAPDSVMAIRTDIARSLGRSVQAKLPGSTLTDIPAVADQFNQRGLLQVFEQLMQTYESTGVLDRQKVSALGQALGSDLLLMSRLKAEKMDIAIISKGQGGSLELSLIDARSGEVVWGGTGEWKRGGVLGFGGASSGEMAHGLISGALASLR